MAAKEQSAPVQAQESSAAANSSTNEDLAMPQNSDMLAEDCDTTFHDATTERIPTTDKTMEFCIPKCEMPPRDVIEPVENVVSAAVEEQHRHASNKKNNHHEPVVDAYKGLIDVLRHKRDAEMMRFVLLALRTSGKGKTLTYLTQSATIHARLIHVVVRLNPFDLLVKDCLTADYAMADAQLHLLMALVSANSVFVVPTLTSLWKMLAVNLETAPVERTSRLHAALAKILRLVPKAKTELFPIIHSHTPFRTRPVGEIQWYYTQTLRVLEYAPSIEANILELIIDRSLEMDVEIKITDAGQAMIDREHDDANDSDADVAAMFAIDMDGINNSPTKAKKKALAANVTVDEMADKLDHMMLLLFQYIARSTDYGRIFRILCNVFNDSILITHKSKFVQFIIFYTCGVGRDEIVLVPVKNGEMEEDTMDRVFVGQLIAILYNPYKSTVTRQTGACYLASFVSRAEFCKPETVCQALHALLRWAEAYMGAVKQVNAADARHQSALHGLFYTVAQAAFYIMCFRGREAWEYHQAHVRADESTEEDIREGKWESLCAHKLNPLKNCLESVRVEFLELADVFSLISDDLRKSIMEDRTALTQPKRKRKALISTPATLEKERLKGGVGGLGRGSNPLDSFFPFDPYLLQRSHVFVEPLYRHWQDCAVANLPEEEDDEDEEEANDQVVSESGGGSDDDDQDGSVADPGLDIPDEDDSDSDDEDTASNQPMSFTSKNNGFDETSPLVRIELGGDFVKTIKRRRAPSIENGSW